METDSATLRLVRPGTPSASNLAEDALPPELRAPRPTRYPGLRFLGLDAHGRAMDWLSWQDATCLYARGAVAWTLGDPCLDVHGGINRLSGERSIIHLHPIIAARGHARPQAIDPTPALTNPALFARDGWRVAHVDVAHRPRGEGRSNYSNWQRGLVGVSDLAGVAWLMRRRKTVRATELTGETR